jgi:putative MATE family efflux protein
MQIDNRAFYGKLRKLAAPIAFQSLMLASVAAGDALMLGRVAQNEMTAVSLATQVQFVQNMFLMSVAGAGSILGAQYWGKGDRETVRSLFNMILRWCGAISLVFFLACELCPRLLMGLFSHDPVILEIGSDYLRIAGWSYLMTGVSLCYQTIMKVTDHVAPCAWISSSAVVLNIGLNAVFIFGLLGFPAMNARGAALATTLARAAEMGLCFFVSSGRDYLRPAWNRFFARQKQLAADFRRQCFPLLGGGLLWGVGFTSYTAIMGHMGTDAAAANAVAAVVRDLMCCVCNGVATAAGIMVGNELGAGNLEKGKAYGIRLKNISYIIGFGSTTVILALTPLVVRMVILTDAARDELTAMMIIMAVYMIGRCVNTITINGVLDGGGDTVFDM